MEVYKQIAFGRSFSLLQWLHHLVILAALPWYYKYYKVCPAGLTVYPAMMTLLYFRRRINTE